MSRYFDAVSFEASAADHFGFLVRKGFAGPYAEDFRLLYVTGKYSVEVHFDDRDGRVVTIIDAAVGKRHMRAALQCLFVEAGLGPAQQVRDIGRSARSLNAALGSQATALEALLPSIDGDQGHELLARCHGT